MTPKHFSDGIHSYDLPKINYLKKLKKKKRIVRSPFSPGMQEHVAGHMGNVRNTSIKNIQIVYCVTKLVGHIVNPFVRIPYSECNKFVLVLCRIDLIHFEHPNIISST